MLPRVQRQAFISLRPGVTHLLPAFDHTAFYAELFESICRCQSSGTRSDDKQIGIILTHYALPGHYLALELYSIITRLQTSLCNDGTNHFGTVLGDHISSSGEETRRIVDNRFPPVCGLPICDMSGNSCLHTLFPYL